MAVQESVKTRTGKIIQVVGVVVDAEFTKGNLPAIYDALEVELAGDKLVLEVAQHLSETTVRAIALSTTDGLKRGHEVVATGAPIRVPVGNDTMGRMFNVIGEPIDGKPAANKAKKSLTDNTNVTIDYTYSKNYEILSETETK